MNAFLYNEFTFSPRYRVWRHVIYWTFHITIWASFWVFMGVPGSYARQLLNMAMSAPLFILFGYPLVYVAIPHLLLKGKVIQFFLIVILWGVAGLFLDAAYRGYIFIPLQQAMNLDYIIPSGRLPSCYLCMTTSVASPMIVKFFKLWTNKQRDWLRAQQENITAELKLLKAQVHPHFLFNTLNNIYAFSLERSGKTPELILKLSSLLSYMLYDCKTEEVRLEKEVETMRNYIGLEKERYGNKIEISWNIEGAIEDKFIAPLMLIPFLENAFKHGTSEQIEKSWLSVDISVKQNTLRCKIANSKNEYVAYNSNGIGINNVKKRLELIYPENHELKINDEGNFFVVSLLINLTAGALVYSSVPEMPVLSQTIPA
jgi:hypothetical protein